MLQNKIFLPYLQTSNNNTQSSRTQSSSSHQYSGKPHNPRSASMARSPSLRMNSNGTAVAGSSKHRRVVANNQHLLQYDVTNGGGKHHVSIQPPVIKYQISSKSELGKVLFDILPGEGHNQGRKNFFTNSDFDEICRKCFVYHCE